jgi:hypothetical protein
VMKDGHLTMTAFCRVCFRAQLTQHLAQIDSVAFAGKALGRMCAPPCFIPKATAICLNLCELPSSAFRRYRRISIPY